MGRDNRDRDRRSGGGRGFDRNDRRPSGRDFGGRSFGGGGRDFNDRERFDAVCDECGEACQVPFRPSSGKPIFCDDCFSKNKKRDGSRDFDRNDRNDRRSSGDSRGGDNGQYKEQLNKISAKLDQVLSILQPTSQDEWEEIEELELGDIEELKPTVKKAAKKETKKSAKKTDKKTAKKKY